MKIIPEEEWESLQDERRECEAKEMDSKRIQKFRVQQLMINFTF